MSMPIQRRSRHADEGPQPASPLDQLQAAFTALLADPLAPTLDGAALGHALPARELSLGELRAVLRDRATTDAARDAVLRVLLVRAQTGTPSWATAVAGLLLPGLRLAAAGLARDYPLDGQAADADADLVAGVFAAIATVDPHRCRLAGRLVSAAYIAARRARRTELAEASHRARRPGPLPPPAPAGHPDLVLAAAVRAGVLDAGEAELIGETRLGGVALVTMAHRLGVAYKTAHQRRRRAESRLLAYLTVENRGAGGI